jgi:hypothetical protein
MTKPTETNENWLMEHKIGPDGHCSDTLLLLEMDGELPPREAQQVRDHLEACWSCRSRQGRIEEAISDVIEYQDHVLKPYLPPPPGPRAVFAARLDQLAASLSQPPWWRRWVNQVSGLQAAMLRPAMISLLIVAALGALIYTQLWKAPVVSADELLQKAQRSESQRLRGFDQPVIYQKLHIRVGDQAMTRTMYRDIAGNRLADRVDASASLAGVQGRSPAPNPVGEPLRGLPPSHPPAVAELEQFFQTARWDWQNPLSATSFVKWRNTLDQKQEVVEQSETIMRWLSRCAGAMIDASRSPSWRIACRVWIPLIRPSSRRMRR